jgi:peptidoglycan/xylan/chitin deacetylase (PgdA/CDA1 family)
MARYKKRSKYGNDAKDTAGIASQVETLSSSVAQQTTKQQESVNLSVNKNAQAIQPLVTFVDDDGTTSAYTKMKTLFDSKGEKFVTAIISGWIGRPGFMTKSQIDDIYNAGHEIASHSVNHDWATTHPEQIKQSYDALNDLGYEVENLVYVGGYFDQNVISETKKYYNCAVVVDRGLNTSPIRTFGLKRFAIGSMWAGNVQDGILEDGSYASYKAMVDKAVATNSWLIFMSHCNNPQHDAVQEQHMSNIIDYIKSLNVPIVTLKEGLKKYGNRVDIGDAETKHFLVGVDGKIKSSDMPPLTKKETSTTITNATPLTSFEFGNETITSIWGNPSSGFPNNASGTLITRYFTHGDISYQEWHPYNFPDAKYYHRRWNSGSGTWFPWTEYASTSYVDSVIAASASGMVVSAVNTYNGGALITDFPNNKVTAFAFNNDANPGFPTSAGICTTYRIHSSEWCYQEVKEYGSWRKWVRYVVAGGNWSAWKEFSII